MEKPWQPGIDRNHRSFSIDANNIRSVRPTVFRRAMFKVATKHGRKLKTSDVRSIEAFVPVQIKLSCQPCMGVPALAASRVARSAVESNYLIDFVPSKWSMMS